MPEPPTLPNDKPHPNPQEPKKPKNPRHPIHSLLDILPEPLKNLLYTLVV